MPPKTMLHSDPLNSRYGALHCSESPSPSECSSDDACSQQGDKIDVATTEDDNTSPRRAKPAAASSGHLNMDNDSSDHADRMDVKINDNDSLVPTAAEPIGGCSGQLDRDYLTPERADNIDIKMNVDGSERPLRTQGAGVSSGEFMRGASFSKYMDMNTVGKRPSKKDLIRGDEMSACSEGSLLEMAEDAEGFDSPPDEPDLIQ